MRYVIAIFGLVALLFVGADIYLTNQRDVAVEYYTSEIRRKQFDELIAHLKQTTGRAMLEQRIPSGRFPDHHPEWVHFQTLPGEKGPWIRFTTHAKGGVARLEDSQEFAIISCGRYYTFTTRDAPGWSGEVVSLGPMSYRLYRSPIDKVPSQGEEVEYRFGAETLHIELRREEPAPRNESLQNKPSLYRIQDNAGNDVNEADIRSFDASFIAEVSAATNSNGSSCIATR